MVRSFKEVSKDSGFGFWVSWGMFNAFFVGSHDVRASFGRSNKHVYQESHVPAISTPYPAVLTNPNLRAYNSEGVGYSSAKALRAG